MIFGVCVTCKTYCSGNLTLMSCITTTINLFILFNKTKYYRFSSCIFKIIITSIFHKKSQVYILLVTHITSTNILYFPSTNIPYILHSVIGYIDGIIFFWLPTYLSTNTLIHLILLAVIGHINVILTLLLQ